MGKIVFLFFVVLFAQLTLACVEQKRAVEVPVRNVDLECLQQAYPEITGLEMGAGGQYLVFANGARVLYAGVESVNQAALDTDVKTSMLVPYVVDPMRPETGFGYAPGRKRSYSLLKTLYGSDKRDVQQNLVRVKALNQIWTLHRRCADKFLAVCKILEAELIRDPSLRPWLKNNGGYCYRTIAGENVPSPHSFGIAVDVGVNQGATYWRWNKARPHPLQKTYPTAIVKAFESQGFIWGGKWHEYDLMHFEYRPELIVKARRTSVTQPDSQASQQDVLR